MPALVNAKALIIRPEKDLLTQHPVLLQGSGQLAIKYAFRKLVTEEELQAYGKILWQVLEKEQELEQAKEGIKIIPVIIESDEPALQQLPWELLWHPQYGFLGREPGFALSRNLTGNKQAPVQPEKGPLRVLLFTSMPDDLDADKSRLDVEEEQVRMCRKRCCP